MSDQFKTAAQYFSDVEGFTDRDRDMIAKGMQHFTDQIYSGIFAKNKKLWSSWSISYFKKSNLSKYENLPDLLCDFFKYQQLLVAYDDAVAMLAKNRLHPSDSLLQLKISTLFDAIKHGDQEHQDWLEKAIKEHFK